MASDPGDIDQNIENLKATVKQSFARIYASVKARERKTLRQLDVIRKQCHNEKRNCVQNIHVSYDNESTLLENIRNYSVIDLEKLNFDNNTFTEECETLDDDQMSSYKTIEDVAIEDGTERHRTNNRNCICFMDMETEEASKQFRKVIIETAPMKPPQETGHIQIKVVTEDERSDSSDPEVVKINPTDDWLNSIKGQTETEPSQVSDVMEHNLLLNNVE